MTGRRNGGRVYLRRSDRKQESSLATQLAWAVAKAAGAGVRLDADPSDLEAARSRRLHRHRHVFLDDAISGADLGRPGLMALVDEVLADRRISHVFVYKRDRLARPDEPAEMMVLERRLSSAGVTIRL